MQLVKSILVASLIFSTSVSNCYAIDPDAVELKAGQQAPYTGVLLSPDRANTVHNQLLQRDLLQELSDSQQKSIDLLKLNNTYTENKLNLLLEQNDKLSERLQSSQSLNNWERLGLVILGVALTVGAGIAISKVK